MITDFHPRRRLVVAGRLADEVTAGIRASNIPVEARAVADGPLSPADAAWADSYCGFSVPDRLTGSGITWFHAMSAGVDALVPLLPDHVLLTRTVGQMPQKIGHYVLAHVLAERHRIGDYRRLQERHCWQPLARLEDARREVAVLGAGAIGLGVARALCSAGFDVTCVSRSGRQVEDVPVRVASSAGDLYRSAAVVVCALPLTSDTRGLVNARILDRLDDAVLVNVGRGACLDERALASALASGHVRHAVLDVFDEEPLSEDSWLWRHDRVTVTPHVSGPTDGADVLADLLETYQQLCAGLRPARLVDTEKGY